MNYRTHYLRLIEKASTRHKPAGYTERHHILPRCEGGGDETENLVYLTAREHYAAHLLLAKWKGGVNWKAVKFMGELTGRVTSRMYSEARQIVVEMRSGENSEWFGKGYLQTGELNHMFGKPTSEHQKQRAREANSKPKSEETKKKMSLAQTGKTASEETKKKMSEQRKGKRLTKEHKMKISQGVTGRSFTEEHKIKLSVSLPKEKRVAASVAGWETRRKNKNG